MAGSWSAASSVSRVPASAFQVATAVASPAACWSVGAASGISATGAHASNVSTGPVGPAAPSPQPAATATSANRRPHELDRRCCRVRDHRWMASLLEAEIKADPRKFWRRAFAAARPGALWSTVGWTYLPVTNGRSHQRPRTVWSGLGGGHHEAAEGDWGVGPAALECVDGARGGQPEPGDEWSCHHAERHRDDDDAATGH